MTDIFFSYSSEDRERVRPIRNALVAEGFDVFWDREAPPDRDRDEWIGQQIDAAHCVMAFWSPHSAASDDIEREARMAEGSGKLVSVLLEPLDAARFPMGRHAAQAVFIPQEGLTLEVLQRLRAEVESRVIHPWMRRKLAELERQVSALTSAAERPQAGEPGEPAGASAAQEEAILRLNNELAKERKFNSLLKTEMAYLESRAAGLERLAAGGETPGSPPEPETAAPYDYKYYRDWYLLIAVMALLISAANHSTPAMVISAVLLLGGVLWGFILR